MSFLRKLSCMMICMATSLMIASCSSDDPTPTPDVPGGNVVDPNAPVNGEMKDASLRGFVTDTQGKPLADVTVISGTHSTVSDKMGSFILTKADVNDERSIVKFEKEGYFSLVRSVKFSGEENWTVALCSKSNSKIAVSNTFSSTTGKEVKVGNLVNNLPANGFKVKETGETYSGTVKAEMVYLDPNDDAFAEMMPGGDLAAVDDTQERVQLVSYGMTSVNLTDDKGTPLQLADGSEATLKFPIPAGMEKDAPEEMPLWSFNEKTGLWVEEGKAVKNGDHYEGKVSHFSWVNLDYPERQGTVHVTVTNTDGAPVRNVVVRVGQVNARTDNNGKLSQVVPAGRAFDVKVESRYYGNYSPEVSVTVDAIPARGSANVSLVLPVLTSVSGRVVRGSDPLDDCVVWLELAGFSSRPEHTGETGEFTIVVSKNLRGKGDIHVISNNVEKTFPVELNGGAIKAGDLQMGEPVVVEGAMSPDEAKKYLEQAGKDFVSMFNPEDQRAVIELCNYFSNTYEDYEMPREWENLDGTAPAAFFSNVGAGLRHTDINTLAAASVQNWHLGLVSGEYTPDSATRRWKKTKDSKNLVFSFPYNGKTAELKVAPSDGTWKFTTDDVTVTIPERIDITLASGGKSMASGVVKSKYNKTGHSLTLEVTMTVANLSVSMTVDGKDSKISAIANASVGGKEVLGSTTVVNGSHMLDPDYLDKLLITERDEYDEWTEVDMEQLTKMLSSAASEINILDRVRFSANVKSVKNILSEGDYYFGSEDFDSKEKAKKECQKWCDNILQNVDNNIYLAGSKVSSVTIKLSPKLSEEDYGWGYTYWEWYPEPLLSFAADGSSYSFADYFDGTGFSSLESQVRSLLESYAKIWNAGSK